MELYLKNTSHGLFPMTDDDYEAKSKLKIGDVYKVTIKKARNYELLKKYFALIKCSWEYLTEQQQAFFKNNKESYRKTVEIAAGHFDLVYSIKRKEWVEQHKSIAFDKVDEFQFREIYDNSRRVIFDVFLRHVSQDEFEKNLIDF